MISLLFSLCMLFTVTSNREPLVIRNVRITGVTGGKRTQAADVLIRDGRFSAIGTFRVPEGARVIDGNGQYMIPALTSGHVHIGTLRGTTIEPAHYTRENILRQLAQYSSFGVLQVLSMGTDHPLLFARGLYDSLRQGLLPGARLYSAGYGFGMPGGAPGAGFPMDKLFRPANTGEAVTAVDSLHRMNIGIVKIWVDDFGTGAPKMAPEIYQAIIQRAHQHQMKVVAHVFYLGDARRLVAAGVDVLGHSIRDSIIDQTLLQDMKAKGVRYIPTLTLDVYATAYGETPSWINDPFFVRSLEPGVADMIRSPDYQRSVREGKLYDRNRRAVQIATQNLRLIAEAGIIICLGTDSGALPVRAQGFAEHHEMELMVKAGMTTVQVLTAATINAAALVDLSGDTGSIDTGKTADFVLLTADPVADILNTRSIGSVWKNGKMIFSADQ
ncbi:amidohydrolase family protein [Flavihumibacter petaseus]|uniref:Amidohydrolase-related domain-containing protein n=1 Tax=Flavihumibacter petaseus NBRC 106054 TaxID=1220578 RepID=A0A0E9MWC9_9BACT|nr:amidohydrolase family protein [Flavihumibacter petaseus]GAO41874.1 hypothetical protein FPE01S_01_08890 [Flavihumibacter petaseus NBRC 106054]